MMDDGDQQHFNAANRQKGQRLPTAGQRLPLIGYEIITSSKPRGYQPTSQVSLVMDGMISGYKGSETQWTTDLQVELSLNL